MSSTPTSARPASTALSESGWLPGRSMTIRSPWRRSAPVRTAVKIGACTALGTKSSATDTRGGPADPSLPPQPAKASIATSAATVSGRRGNHRTLSPVRVSYAAAAKTGAAPCIASANPSW
jgi:hypothetical protein